MKTIYRLYFRDVCLFLQGLTRSETLAEELTQETFFRALDGLKDYDGKQDVRAWLFTVARNAYYDHCRRAKATPPRWKMPKQKAADSPDIAQLFGGQGCRLYGAPVSARAGRTLQGGLQPAGVLANCPLTASGLFFGHNAAWARVTYYRAKTRLQTMLEQRK